MDRRQLLRNLIAAGAVSLASGASFPQLPEKKEASDDFTFRSDVRLVVLDVGVKDQKGAFVSHLEQNNFRIFEDGRPQEIRIFAREDSPATLGILVDESYSMRPKRSDVLQAAQTFIAMSNPEDEMFVLNFNDSVRPGLPPEMPFSSDPRTLRSALYGGMSQGKTALNDAIVQGLSHLHDGHQARKGLLLISDGGDNASSHTRQQMLSAVEANPATIYTIGLFDEDDSDRVPGLLKQISWVSGGECFLPRQSTEMTSICSRIAEDIRARYSIGYVPPTGNKSGKTRRVRVEVKSPEYPKLSALTRTSYRFENEGGDASPA